MVFLIIWILIMIDDLNFGVGRFMLRLDNVWLMCCSGWIRWVCNRIRKMSRNRLIMSSVMVSLMWVSCMVFEILLRLVVVRLMFWIEILLISRLRCVDSCCYLFRLVVMVNLFCVVWCIMLVRKCLVWCVRLVVLWCFSMFGWLVISVIMNIVCWCFFSDLVVKSCLFLWCSCLRLWVRCW